MDPLVDKIQRFYVIHVINLTWYRIRLMFYLFISINFNLKWVNHSCKILNATFLLSKRISMLCGFYMTMWLDHDEVLLGPIKNSSPKIFFTFTQIQIQNLIFKHSKFIALGPAHVGMSIWIYFLAYFLNKT